jgi:hypothetical protein
MPAAARAGHESERGSFLRRMQRQRQPPEAVGVAVLPAVRRESHGTTGGCLLPDGADVALEEIILERDPQ